ncbi:hypothetical protein DPMN_026757 [Dreissena polymorpha]|uniref:Uncharacterized protein n=1 Tax=Dreissena polymorpha TaxID=45954 RepID=A0A9D4LU00_DREPO|nr:hypothetical protein DPMN_026757 [Dreissena polymorpha]
MRTGLVTESLTNAVTCPLTKDCWTESGMEHSNATLGVKEVAFISWSRLDNSASIGAML